MKTRAITGLFFVIVMLGSVLLGQYVFSGFYLLLSAFCLREFYGLISQTGVKPNTRWGIINGVVLFAVMAYGCYAITVMPSTGGYHPHFNDLLWLPMFMLPVIFMQELYTKAQAPFTNIAYSFLGLLLTIIPFACFHAMAFIKGSFNFHIPLGFLLMLWANDTGAYLTGRAFGKHKLFERHSPKKTWEGFFGGMIISAGVGLLLSHYYPELLWKQWLCIGIIISGFGTMGDLVESMFKRSIDVKDSGSILPGHGGLLDRFDGLFMAAPIVYGFLYFITN